MPRPRARQLLPSAPAGDGEDWEGDDDEGEGLLETEYEGLEEEWPEEPQPARAAHTRPGRRDLQMIAAVVPGAQQTPTDAWSLVPKWQTQMIGRITRDTDLWGSLRAVMRERFGPRWMTSSWDHGTHRRVGLWPSTWIQMRGSRSAGSTWRRAWWAGR